MAYVDKIACISTMCHCRKTRCDCFKRLFLIFWPPIKTGDAINLEAYVTCAHRTSMEVFVKVERENLLTGEKQLTARAFLTMLAIDEDGKPTNVPQVIPETEEEKQQYVQAQARYIERKKKRN
ncbi:acyl-CoA thioesterase [Peribacillus frigoritolerans]|nr:acyl-CoA thioesterase [Peribacillus frigoritolerans]